MASAGAEKAAQAVRFKCTECAAEMTFDATSGKLKCRFCGATRDVPAENEGTVEHAFARGVAAERRGLGVGPATRTSKCQECGASVLFADGVTSTSCTFCGSSQVLTQAENRQAICPESLLPFSVDKSQAQFQFRTWLAKLWFRPDGLKKLAAVQDLAGVYVPFWTYDAHVESSWSAEAGYDYHVTEPERTTENGREVTRQREVERTRWESTRGQRADDYDDVLVCASVGLPRDLADAVSTFDTKRLRDYSPAFLVGWRAEEYAVDLQQGLAFARGKVEAAQALRCGRDVPGDRHRNLRVQNTFSSVTYKHVLLPVWIAAYRYNGRVFRFLVNGENGDVVGKAPWSWVKITLFSVMVSAIAFAAWYSFYYYYAFVRTP